MALKPMKRFQKLTFTTTDFVQQKIRNPRFKHTLDNSSLILLFSTILLLFCPNQKSVFAADISKWNGEAYINIEDVIPKQSYLTEYQAREIIMEEASKADVHFNLRTKKIWDDLHYMYEYFDTLDRFIINNSLVTTFGDHSKSNPSNIYYFDNDWTSGQNELQLDQKSDPYSQFSLGLVIDAMDLHKMIACAYISEDDCNLFLYRSPDKFGDNIYQQLNHKYSLISLGIFTRCDEAALRFQVRSFLSRVINEENLILEWTFPN